ncbi:phosphatase PAP2 family protein [Pseudomonas protegens]|uniref:acid phosphatase n=1 Tax=Pseudomonas protegens TaxID=380021 RepID=UPI001475FEA8|nr:phosphatase PAP2 family protein [Pseudomonas protegens]NMZ29601.1 phosphatase PAP2 family protein [Pseudomonas protegens]NMZ86659.1 phosphatase PAP2 family protein [Pseudomonas protegens]
MKKIPEPFAVTLSLAGLLWSAWALAEDAATKVTDPHFKLAPGYLEPADLPVRLALLGAPPKPGSAALARDEEARRAALALRGSSREKLAATDAELSFPGPAKTFSCALGTQISEKSTPHLYTLMQRTLTDAGGSTYAGKNAYNRTRPFVVHDEGTCRKDMEPLLRTDGSWPSGHSAAGWAWGLVLAEISPARATELMTRGLAYGQSRVICDAHWQSDVDAGRIMGAAKEEVKAAQQAGLKPAEDCAAEGVALGLTQH